MLSVHLINTDNQEYSTELTTLPTCIQNHAQEKEGLPFYALSQVGTSFTSDQEAKSPPHGIPETHVYDFPPVSEYGQAGAFSFRRAPVQPLRNYCATIQIHFTYLHL